MTPEQRENDGVYRIRPIDGLTSVVELPCGCERIGVWRKVDDTPSYALDGAFSPCDKHPAEGALP